MHTARGQVALTMPDIITNIIAKLSAKLPQDILGVSFHCWLVDLRKILIYWLKRRKLKISHFPAHRYQQFNRLFQHQTKTKIKNCLKHTFIQNQPQKQPYISFCYGNTCVKTIAEMQHMMYNVKANQQIPLTPPGHTILTKQKMKWKPNITYCNGHEKLQVRQWRNPEKSPWNSRRSTNNR